MARWNHTYINCSGYLACYSSSGKKKLILNLITLWTLNIWDVKLLNWLNVIRFNWHVMKISHIKIYHPLSFSIFNRKFSLGRKKWNFFFSIASRSSLFLHNQERVRKQLQKKKRKHWHILENSADISRTIK